MSDTPVRPLVALLDVTRWAYEAGVTVVEAKTCKAVIEKNGQTGGVGSWVAFVFFKRGPGDVRLIHRPDGDAELAAVAAACRAVPELRVPIDVLWTGNGERAS